MSDNDKNPTIISLPQPDAQYRLTLLPVDTCIMPRERPFGPDERHALIEPDREAVRDAHRINLATALGIQDEPPPSWSDLLERVVWLRAGQASAADESERCKRLEEERDEALAQRDCIIYAITNTRAVIDDAIEDLNGTGEDEGTFYAAGFSSAASRRSGTSVLLDGRWVRAIVQDSCRTLKAGGSHFERRESDASRYDKLFDKTKHAVMALCTIAPEPDGSVPYADSIARKAEEAKDVHKLAIKERDEAREAQSAAVDSIEHCASVSKEEERVDRLRVALADALGTANQTPRWDELLKMVRVLVVDSKAEDEPAEELRRCPFCDGEPCMSSTGFEGADPTWFVQCLGCEAGAGTEYSRAEAVRVWNRRPFKSSPVISEPIPPEGWARSEEDGFVAVVRMGELAASIDHTGRMRCIEAGERVVQAPEAVIRYLLRYLDAYERGCIDNRPTCDECIHCWHSGCALSFPIISGGMKRPPGCTHFRRES